MKVQILTRSKKPLIADGLDIDDEATVEELKKEVYKVKKKYDVVRQRFTLPPVEGQKSGTVLQDSVKLVEYGVQSGSTIYFKDLGPQVRYGTVFFWEYFGPLMVYPIFYFFPQIYWWSTGLRQFASSEVKLFVSRLPPEKGLIQTLALVFWSFHYIKRILETFLVHQFSHATMPVQNLFKNCIYYWGFAAYVSYFINHPLYTSPPATRAFILFPLAFLCEFANLQCHLILKNLRVPGEKDYKIPKGFLFDYITCANYTMEIGAWFCFTFATQSLTSLFFTIAGALQMAQWAAGKHKRLVKMFDGKNGQPKYPKRWKMIPFLF